MTERTRQAIGWTLVAGLVSVELYRRVAGGAVPLDFSAYIAAADVWAQGGNPYGPDLFAAERYRGYVYVYAPGTLPLISILHWMPSTVLSVAELVARAGVWIGLAAWFRRFADLEAPVEVLLLVGLIYEPLFADLVGGNLTTFMLGAVLACKYLASRTFGGWRMVLGIPLGIAFSFKPMWLVPAATVVGLERDWRLAGSLAGGVAVVVGLTVDQWHLAEAWLARIEGVRVHYQSVDLLSFGRWLRQGGGPAWLLPPVLPAVGMLVWAGLGLRLVGDDVFGDGDVGQGNAPVWIWACVSLVAWPRLGSYSYVLMIPVLGFMWRRLSRRSFLWFAAPALGPVAFLLRNVGTGLYHRMLLYVWGVAAAAWLYRELAPEP